MMPYWVKRALSLKIDLSKDRSFLKKKPCQVENNNSTGKFTIHPFGQEVAILNENGLF
jgi:hypothetical protein